MLLYEKEITEVNTEIENILNAKKVHRVFRFTIHSKKSRRMTLDYKVDNGIFKPN